MPGKLQNYPHIKISSGSIEGLKWLGMIFMTIDHINRFFVMNPVNWAYSVGRIAMPLFAFVFVYNLARPHTFSPQVYIKSFKRLILFGILATPAYIEMKNIHGLFPLNILFTFLVSALVIFLYEKEETQVFGAFIFLIGGILVEYNWPGILICVSSWLYCKKPSFKALIFCYIAYFFLNLVNGNNWALLAIPMIILASHIDLKIPRIPYLFWVYYPLHLTILYLIKLLIIAKV